jgi:uncharacterized protein YbjT (DUF2867 family)
VLLLTGATGLVGSALLRRLTASRTPVRCLVRDPRRLGADRVRVQLALGDLADPPSFRNALRGVTTVVHLAGPRRDQAGGSIEELNAIATWRLVQAAERARVERFVLVGALGASTHDRTRFLRAKALAEEAVQASELRTAVVAPSLVYGPGDRLATTVGRLAAVLPVVPVSGSAGAASQPIAAADVAACLHAIADDREATGRFELAGPETFTTRELVRAVAAAQGRRRRVLPVPTPLAYNGLRATEALMKSRAPLSWDEVELLHVRMTAAAGTRDAERLGVTPQRLAAALPAG